MDALDDLVSGGIRGVYGFPLDKNMVRHFAGWGITPEREPRGGVFVAKDSDFLGCEPDNLPRYAGKI